MNLRICPNCNFLFNGGDKIRAVVLSDWISLKSKVTVAIGQPTDCIAVEHVSCQYPKTGGPEGD